MLLTVVMISMISSIYILPRIIDFIIENSKPVKNFRGNYVYNSAGIFFSINIMLLCMTSILYLDNNLYNEITALIIGVLSSSLTGFIDDNSKDEIKGISGHLKCLLNGKVTSGSIKAFVGVIMSFVISLNLDQKGIYIILSIAIILLMQNFINLMDLRPLRAVKAYIIFFFIYIISWQNNPSLRNINIGILISLLFYAKYERNEICMMGDTGSNVLGMTLGILIVSLRNIYLKIGILAFLIVSQIYGDRRSISGLIERNMFLRYVDMLGRGDIGDKNKEGDS